MILKMIDKTTIFLIFFLSFNILSAQVKGFSAIEPEKLLQEDAANKLAQQQTSRSDMLPLGNVVEPDYYYVGPGDIISIQNLTSSITQDLVTVSPECSLLLPRICQINLKGKTLAETRKLILDTIKQRNPQALAFVSLYHPRSVIISITGNVDQAGTYSFPASYRISTAIKVANLTQSQNMLQQAQIAGMMKMRDMHREKEKLFNQNGIAVKLDYSTRNIIVLHNDGSSTINDLEKAAVLSSPAYDGYIREGDEIIVPFEESATPTISISGAVSRPCIASFKKGDKASLLLKFGYGFKFDADLDNISLIQSGNNPTNIKVDSALNIIGQDYDLEPGSTIMVGRKTELESKQTSIIAVAGKVKKPGNYIIQKNVSRLKDAIEMAGGFTDDAYLPLGYVMRNDNRTISPFNPYKAVIETFQYSDLTLEDTTRFNLDVNYRKPIVSCDFEAAFRNNSERDNILLIDGDVIVVPEKPKSVYIFGQVNQPGYVTFAEDKTIDWYIEKAGGYAIRSEKSRARIIRGKNKIWIKSDSDTRVLAGDEIYVPRPPDIPPGVELQTYSLIATGVTTAISLFYLLITVFRK